MGKMRLLSLSRQRNISRIIHLQIVFAFIVIFISFSTISSSVVARKNCFVSNCQRVHNNDSCADSPDKTVAIYKERCELNRRKKGTVAICCSPNSVEGMLITAYGAERHEFPHMVHVQDNCGGTLYNSNFVITAAHCVTQMEFGTTDKNKTFLYEDPIEDEDVFVRLGSNIKINGEKVKAEKVYIHPFYSGLLSNLKTDEDKLRKDRPILYDLALIKLSVEADISERVRTLKLADKGFMPSRYSKRAIMLGWGTTDDLKTWFGSYYLQKVNAPIRSERECPIWETEPYPKHKNKLICVGGYVDDDYGPTAGPGDSGGPLICKDEKSRAVLCGVASFAGNPSDCAKRIKNARCYPNAFTSISYFHDWIVSIAGPQEEKDLYRPVVNGEESKRPTDFPHAVYINSTDGMACGGTIIASDVVLTAAHCVLDEKANIRVDLTVYAGLQSNDPRRVQTFLVHLVHGPPKFRKRWNEWIEGDSTLIISDRPYFHEDIILIQLDQPIEENKYVFPLSWAKEENEITDEVLEISWKTLRDGSPFIQKRKFSLLENEICQERLDRVLPVRKLSLSHSSFCAVEEYSGGSACDRTTGGPMICSTKRESYLCGIQSFRFCSFAFPNVVTNVAKFVDWIEEGLERFERQKDIDENDYDYDYYGDNPPMNPEGPSPEFRPEMNRPRTIPRPLPPFGRRRVPQRFKEDDE